jgi:hypothetical protein
MQLKGPSKIGKDSSFVNALPLFGHHVEELIVVVGLKPFSKSRTS